MLKIAESFRTNAHSEHLVFISVIFGYILKLFYSILPNVNWFITMYLVVLNIAFIALCAIVKKLGEHIIGYGVLIAVQMYVLSNLTFTSISFICAVAGMLYMFVFVKKLDKASIKHIIIGLVLLVCAFCMRRADTFYFTVLLFVPLYIFSFLKKRNTIAVLAVIIVCCTFSNYFVIGVQNVYNNSMPSEVYFSEFRKYRADANDGGLFNYDRHGEELQKSGITENDYYLLKRWVFGDKKVFPSEAMKAVADSRDFDEKYIATIEDDSEILAEISRRNAMLEKEPITDIQAAIIDIQAAINTGRHVADVGLGLDEEVDLDGDLELSEETDSDDLTGFNLDDFDDKSKKGHVSLRHLRGRTIKKDDNGDIYVE